jgi:hypothetical protein
MAVKFSEVIRKMDISQFVRKGDIKKDAIRYSIKHNFKDFGINYIALRLSFGDTITVHTLTDGVAKKINRTAICDMPCEIPHFLTQPFIIEARHDNILFSDVVCISGYLYCGELFLISILSDGGAIIQHEINSYDGRSLENINFFEYGSSKTNKKLDRVDTLAFVTILALMMEAERTPIVVENVRDRNWHGGNKIKPNNYKSDWIEKRVYIDKKYTPQNMNGTHREMDAEGKILKDVYVRGFLRRQAYGPDKKLRKWIYVEGFDSTRWANPGHTKIIVDIHDK